MYKELVLTGIPELWPKTREAEKNAVYLGPWCFSDNPGYKFWEQENFELAKSPWKTWEHVKDAAEFCDKLIDRLMPAISAMMNDLHKIDKSQKFWETIFISWLVHWVNVVYDRYRRMEFLLTDSTDQYVVKIPLENSHDFNHQDFMEFDHLSFSHEYNIFIFEEILYFFKKNLNIIRINYVHNTRVDNKIVSLKLKPEIKRLIGKSLFIIKKIWNIFDSKSKKNKLPVIGRIYGVNLWRKCFTFLCNEYSIISDDIPVILKSGFEKRDISFGLFFKPKNDFEVLLMNVFIKSIPHKFLKYYALDQKIASRLSSWIGNDVYDSIQKRFIIAGIREAGGQWISVQHGGGYGHLKSFPIGNIEYKRSDGFVTWGWNYNHNYAGRFLPMVSPVLSTLAKYRLKNNKIYYITTCQPAYYYRLHSTLRPEDMLSYMKNKVRILNGIRKEIRSNVEYRPYFTEYGQNDKEYIQKMSDVRLNQKGMTNKIIRFGRLVIIDHISTSFLETFAMNVPTILFLNPNHFSECDEARVYFDKLRRVGILHDDPESASDLINNIWPNVGGWWMQDDIQLVISEFCNLYARTSKDWKKEWRLFLNSVSV
jgi:putative transferase (TIGR04331 family)